MKNILFKLTYILLFATLFTSCNKNNVGPDTTNNIKLAEAVTTGNSFKVAMFATDSAFVGYNRVYFKVMNITTKKLITQAALALHPLMDMGMGMAKHACPWENPIAMANADSLFAGAVVFSMAGTNSWSVGVDVTANGKTETAVLNLPKVSATNPVQKIVVIDSVYTNGVLTQTKYPISLIKPISWKVGMNNFEIIINQMQDMMTFPAVNDLSVEITPSMPSMGHGSPNNVNPVNIGNGHYLGSVNFTMTGAWRISMVLKKAGRTMTGNPYFDITF